MNLAVLDFAPLDIASVITVIASLAVLGLLSIPRLVGSELWKATVTPLASIIGSGFLVVGPVLIHAFGGWAPLAMLALCAVAYFFGAVMRRNILDRHCGNNRHSLSLHFETASSWVLALAYVISVTYYLNLFGAFAVRTVAEENQQAGRMITSGVLILILALGWHKGFAALEKLEQASVSLKLAVIAGLLGGLMVFGVETGLDGDFVFNPLHTSGWQALTLMFGLIVTVQGFETSRYLSDEYGAAVRIRSMKLAQWLSAGIYLAYVVLLAYLFTPDQTNLSETAIIDLMGYVAPVLPVLLILAALSAQLSAAIADTGGCGGLVRELTRHKISERQTYALLVSVGLILTWAVDIFAIISYASRAFALYYALQCAVAALNATHGEHKRRDRILFGGLALLGFFITLLGAPVE